MSELQLSLDGILFLRNTFVLDLNSKYDSLDRKNDKDDILLSTEMQWM